MGAHYWTAFNRFDGLSVQPDRTRLVAPVIRFAPPGAECECVYAAGRGFQLVVCVGNERMPESSPGSVEDRHTSASRVKSCPGRRRAMALPFLLHSANQAISCQVCLHRLATA